MVIAALVVVDRPEELGAPHHGLLALTLWACFQVGDIANCLHDCDLDALRKVALSQAVMDLGLPRVRLHLLATALLALMGGVLLACWQGTWWWLPGLAGGLVLAWQYSAPPWRLKGRGLW